MRGAAGLIGFIALFSTLALVYGHNVELGGNALPQAIWNILIYFTVLTNVLVGLFLMRAALTGVWTSFSLLTALTLWISIVGVVYHLILSAEHNPVGLMSATNIAHHTIVPLGTFLIWILAKPRSFIPKHHPFLWLIFPFGYGLYALLRGTFIDGGTYPYFYMDPAVVGWKGVVMSQLIFTGLFLGLGYLYLWISNRLAKRQA